LAEFQNPQQEPGMERRLLIVFALTFLVIMLFQPLLKKYGPQPPAKPESAPKPRRIDGAAGSRSSRRKLSATSATLRPSAAERRTRIGSAAGGNRVGDGH
jgi:hypothetical protein